MQQPAFEEEERNNPLVLGCHRTALTSELLDAAESMRIEWIDTAPNYASFRGHHDLRRYGVCDRFRVMTKVGYFWDADERRAHHTLEPRTISQAVTHYADEIGGVPQVVLLHNLDEYIAGKRSNRAAQDLDAVFTHMEQLKDLGYCGSWGFSCWSLRYLPQILSDPARNAPSPGYLMVRSGLLVTGEHITQCEKIFDLYPNTKRIGMSPFRGNTLADAITQAPSRLMVPGETNAYRRALRISFELPEVDFVAVGVSRVEQLLQLHGASELHMDTEMLARYRIKVVAG